MLSRIKLFFVWIVVSLSLPLVQLVMLAQTVAGSQQRANNMALGYDQTLNTLFGGIPTMTVSSRIGNGLVEGKSWAKPAAAFVDFFFGKGHCASWATIKQAV